MTSPNANEHDDGLESRTIDGVTYYPLTQSQNLMFYNLKYSFRKQVVNICSLVDLYDELDEKRLVQAVYLAMMRIPSNSVRIHMIDKRPWQYFADDVPHDIEIVDMSERTQHEVEEYCDGIGSKPFPDGGNDVQLYRVRIIRRAGGLFSLYYCVSHVVFDAYSLMSCLTYTFDIYRALCDGTALPDEPYSPLPAYKADFAQQKGERYRRQVQWWKKHFATEPHFTSVNGLKGKEFIKGERYGVTLRLWQTKGDMVDYRIDRRLVKNLRDYCERTHLPLQVPYFVALRTFLGRMSGTDDVMFMNAVARRATLAQKRAGGTMVNAVALRTVIPGSTSFADACGIFLREQMDAYRRANVATADILDSLRQNFDLKPCRGYASVSTTFQPYFNGDLPVRFRFRRRPNGANTMPLYISIMPLDASGDLWANYEYIVGYVEPESIRRLHRFLLAFLDEVVKNPDRAIDQIATVAHGRASAMHLETPEDLPYEITMQGAAAADAADDGRTAETAVEGEAA